MEHYHIFVTFGTDHTHTVLGKTVGYRHAAKIYCDNHSQGREIAFALFGPKFCTSYEADGANENITNGHVVLFHL